MGLGLFKDDIDRLMAAVAYLLSPPATNLPAQRETVPSTTTPS